MFRLAALLAAFAFTPADAATIGALPHSIAEEERKQFAQCTWPWDPLSPSTRFVSPKGTIIMSDASMLLGMMLFLVLGAPLLYLDMCDLCEEEDNTEVAKALTEKSQGEHALEAAANAMPQIVAIFAVMSAAFFQILPGGRQASFCQRMPLHAAAKTMPLLMDAGAFAELSSLLPARAPAASDEMTILVIGLFALLGLLFMCIDFCTFVAELDTNETEEQTVAGGEVYMTDTMKSPDTKTWSEHLAKHWRMVSCVVLLYAIACTAVASIWENVI